MILLTLTLILVSLSFSAEPYIEGNGVLQSKVAVTPRGMSSSPPSILWEITSNVGSQQHPHKSHLLCIHVIPIFILRNTAETGAKVAMATQLIETSCITIPTTVGLAT